MFNGEGPPTEVMAATDVRRNWATVLNQVARRKKRAIVEKNGVPVAAIISADDLEWFAHLESQRRAGFAALERIGMAFKDVPDEEIEEEVAKALAEVRAEGRRREAREA
ncbi:MAG: type II toxin-antitoxin system Phd/YefM family antitoxin [Chloroflexi bacterium]|nr:type II toxin-antitoxin system Phd/YefM family antitoxin [Chloroflexota bacterium]